MLFASLLCAVLYLPAFFMVGDKVAGCWRAGRVVEGSGLLIRQGLCSSEVQILCSPPF